MFIAAVDPRVTASRNDYIGPEFVMAGKPVVQATLPQAWDEAAQKKLWEESVKLTGVNFITV